MQRQYSSLDLTDDQFIKIRRSSNGYAVLLKFVQRRNGRPVATVTKETKADNFEELLKDRQWNADLLHGMINNLIVESFRKLELNNYSNL